MMKRREFLKTLSGALATLLLPGRALPLIATQIRKAGNYILAMPYLYSFGLMTRDGRSWKKVDLPDTYAWRTYSDIAWNGSLYCAVGEGYKFATSPDGTTWTQRTVPIPGGEVGDWVCIAWSGSVFCALSTNTNYAATSPDGIVWTIQTLPVSAYWSKIAWNGSVFCVSGLIDACLTSPDGITWTQHSSFPQAALSGGWQSIEVKGTTFCMLGRTINGTDCAGTSTDGTNWALATPAAGTPNYNTTIRSNGTIFCAVSKYFSAVTAVSSDGLNWTVGTNILPSPRFVASFGSKFVAIESSSNRSYVSTDGLNWTQGSVVGAYSWTAGASDGTTFVAIATSSSTAAISTDGLNWTLTTMPSSANWMDIAWNGSVFCAVASGSNKAATSPDGVTWTARTLPWSIYWRRIIWNGSTFCVVSQSNGVARSSDGITWSGSTLPKVAAWSDLAWNGTVFYTVASGSPTEIATSTNGISWTLGYGPTIDGSGNKWNVVGSIGSNLYAIASNSKTIAKSSDNGSTWTPASLPKPGRWSSIAGSGSMLVVAGYDGVCSSPNGTSWTLRNAGILNAVVAWRSSMFVVLGYGNALSSPDGINWTARTLPTGFSSRAVATDGTKFVAVGTDDLSNDGAPGSIVGAASSDGINWTTTALPGMPIRNTQWYGLAWNGKVFVAVSYLNVYSSPDGLNWKMVTLAQSDYWEGAVAINGKIMISGWDWFAFSTDAQTWTFTDNDNIGDGIVRIATNGSVYVGIPIYGDIVTSNDLATWDWPDLPYYTTWTNVVWNGKVFCAVGEETDQCLTSPDAETWTQHTLPLETNWIGVPWNGRVFCMIGRNSSVVLTSKDGATWSQYAMPISTSWSSLDWSGKFFVATSDSGKGAYSADGAHWTLVDLPATLTLSRPASNDQY